MKGIDLDITDNNYHDFVFYGLLVLDLSFRIYLFNTPLDTDLNDISRSRFPELVFLKTFFDIVIILLGSMCNGLETTADTEGKMII